MTVEEGTQWALGLYRDAILESEYRLKAWQTALAARTAAETATDEAYEALQEARDKVERHREQLNAWITKETP